ncbi:excinuclease ABC subunit C [Spiroplasma sabaudiense Ar-1343]|uniref:UvrABC system protein C n=1 Tax=Spiroplasma sabaudiense Ar-1343 TaxID=1276257 RepID=W6ABD7_9MOLU|nr:excinuclease ABC subunit UvrC [Spiroplasma sabaudiense]AHI54165.1 excinuclease ABC subunit C [Spiroplasma sabaudiense Ar-1343]
MEIKDKITTISDKSGCYLFLNLENKIIYVGKAKNLKRRVSSYFKKVSNIKTMQLVRSIADIKIMITESEQQALILEQNLIKKYKPRFNIVLNDDKNYPYIAITNQANPQYKYIRKYDKNSLKSYGPLPDGSSAREILKMLERLYPLWRCGITSGKPCLYYHIQQCSGACFKEVEWNYYQEMINQVDAFFNYDNLVVQEKLILKMTKAAENLQFEEAGRIKKLIEHLSFSKIDQEIDLNDNLNRDIVAGVIENDKISFVILFYRSGKLLFKDEYIGDYQGQEITELYESYLAQIYSKNMLPDFIVIDNEFDLSKFVENYSGKLVNAAGITEKKMWDLALLNAKESLKQSNLASAIVNNNESTILKKLQEILGLKSYPQHIEMFDVANILDEHVTGAMVVFKGGKPSYSDFRRYNIDISDKGDYQRFQNMVYRRYQKLLKGNLEAPDLIIADGGIIQVNAILSQLEILGLEIPVIGLVKNERHKTDHIIDLDKNPLKIKTQSSLFNLLAKIQDTVHNFAISGFRNKQTKSLTQNFLEKIPGIGPTTISKIHSIYPTLNDIKQASVNDLKKIIKNQKALDNLLVYLHDQK